MKVHDGVVWALVPIHNLQQDPSPNNIWAYIKELYRKRDTPVPTSPAGGHRVPKSLSRFAN